MAGKFSVTPSMLEKFVALAGKKIRLRRHSTSAFARQKGHAVSRKPTVLRLKKGIRCATKSRRCLVLTLLTD